MDPLLGVKSASNVDSCSLDGVLPRPDLLVQSFNKLVSENEEVAAKLEGGWNRGWEDGFVDGMQCTLAVISELYLQQLHELDTRFRAFVDLSNKPKLIAAHGALDSLLMKTYNSASIDTLFYQMQTTLQDYCQKSLGTSSTNHVSQAVSIYMGNILAFMVIRGKDPEPKEDTNSSSFSAAKRLVLGPNMTVVHDGTWKTIREIASTHPGDKFDVSTAHRLTDPAWAMNRGFQTLAVIYNKDHPRHPGSMKDASMKQYNEVILNVFRDLLCSIRDQLGVRLSNALALQNKVLSLATTGTISLVTYLMKSESRCN